MVEDAVEAIGFGRFQWKLSVLTGLAWVSLWAQHLIDTPRIPRSSAGYHGHRHSTVLSAHSFCLNANPQSSYIVMAQVHAGRKLNMVGHHPQEASSYRGGSLPLGTQGYCEVMVLGQIPTQENRLHRRHLLSGLGV